MAGTPPGLAEKVMCALVCIPGVSPPLELRAHVCEARLAVGLHRHRTQSLIGRRLGRAVVILQFWGQWAWQGYMKMLFWMLRTQVPTIAYSCTHYLMLN